MKKILFVITAMEVGGIETYLLRFLKYSNNKNKKFDSIVLCKSGKSGVLKDEYESNHAKILLQKLSYFSLKDYLQLYRHLKNEKVDVVCDFSGDFSGLVLLTAKLAKIKRRIAFHRESRYQFVPTVSKLLYAKIMNYLVKNNATNILSNSKTALDEFHPHWQKNGSLYNVLYNGIPLFRKIDSETKDKIRDDLRIPQNAFLIGHVGRYTSAKNHKQIIKVAKVLVDKNPHIYFLLCGRDVDKALEQEVINLGLDYNIIMPGSRSDISDILQCLNVFYFPSLNEGQPNALLEAMILGVPVVASNIEPIKELFPEKYSKYLVDPNDTENAVKLLTELIEKPFLYPTKEIQNWTNEHFNAKKQFEKFYIQLIGEL